jgi:hypothetical protein
MLRREKRVPSREPSRAVLGERERAVRLLLGLRPVRIPPSSASSADCSRATRRCRRSPQPTPRAQAGREGRPS